MAAQETTSLNSITEEMQKQRALIKSILETMGKTGKAIRENNADTSKYTGYLKAIHTAHEGILGSVGREARIVYNLAHKFWGDSEKASQKAVKAAKDVTAAQVEGYRKRLDAIDIEAAAISRQHGGQAMAHPEARGRLVTLSNERATLSEAVEAHEATATAAESTAEATSATAESMAGAATGAEGVLTAMAEAAPEIAAVGYLVEKIGAEFVHILDTSREFNLALIMSNGSMANRNRLFRDALNLSIGLGISQKESTEVLASMVAHGQQFSDSLYQDSKTVAMLHSGLGVSVDTSADLLASSKSVGQSYDKLADTLANIQSSLGVSAEEAAKMAISINQVLPFFGPQSGNTTGNITGRLSAYAAVLNANGDGAQTSLLTGLLAKIAANPTGMLSLRTGGIGASASTHNDLALAALQQAGAAVHGAELTGSPLAVQLQLQQQEAMLGVGHEFDQLLLKLYTDVDTYNKRYQTEPEFRRAMDLQHAYNDQMTKAQKATDLLKNSFDSLIMEASIPLVNIFQALTATVVPFLNGIAKFMHDHEAFFDKASKDVGIVAGGAFDLWAASAKLELGLPPAQVWSSLKSHLQGLVQSVDANTGAVDGSTDYMKELNKDRSIGVAFSGQAYQATWTPTAHGRFNLDDRDTNTIRQLQKLEATFKGESAETRRHYQKVYNDIRKGQLDDEDRRLLLNAGIQQQSH